MLDKNQKHKVVITCLPGIRPALEEEVRQLGFSISTVSDKTVETTGDFSDIVKLNYCLRTANRVLLHIDSFRAQNPKRLYKILGRIEWEKHIKSDGYICIDSFVRNQYVKDTRYANLVVKDAIADHFINEFGVRPDSGPDKSKTVFFLHWVQDQCDLFFDTSGETLSRHGYRQNPWKAPLQESLAAAIILSSTWKHDQHFLNPMCGSGTLAIEAAMMLSEKYPGTLRNNYGFMHILDFDYSSLSRLRDQFEGRISKGFKQKILATDNNIRALNAARENARKAGVDSLIDFQLQDYTKTELPEGKGVLVLNPEYGERMGEAEKLENTYKEIGDFFKQKCAGYTGYVFTGNLQLAKKIGLRTSRRIPFFNGKIECRLLEYELYQGRK